MRSSFRSRFTIRALVVAAAFLTAWPSGLASAADADSTATPAGLSTGVGAASPPAGEIWSIARCIETALKQNGDARSASARTKQASGGALRAWSNILPSVTGSASYTRTEPDKRSSIRSLEVITPTDTSTFVGSVSSQKFGSIAGSADMNLFNIPAWSAKKESDHRRTSAVLSEAETRNDVVFQVKQQYFTCVKAKRLAEVARDSEKLARDEETRSEALFQVGSVARGDVLKARARRATTQLSRIQADNQVNIQRQKLKQLIGVELATSLDVDPAVNEGEVALPDSSAVVGQAVRSRPSLASAHALERAARASLFGAQTARVPKVTGSVDVQRSRITEDQDYVGYGSLTEERYSTQWSSSIRLSVPFFDGLATEGNLRAAKGSMLESEAARRQLELNVAVEAQQAWLDLREAVERIAVAREGVASAEEDHKFSKGRYELGAGTYLDLLNAEVSLEQARQQLVEALADARVAEAALERAIGERRY
jgi:outer membrane protein